MTGDSSALVIGLIVATSIVVYWAILWSRETGKRKQRLDESKTGTSNELPRQDRNVRVPGLHLRSGEFVVRHDTATLAKFVWARVGRGTRVRVGPISVGGWKSSPEEELREVALAIWF